MKKEKKNLTQNNAAGKSADGSLTVEYLKKLSQVA